MIFYWFLQPKPSSPAVITKTKEPAKKSPSKSGKKSNDPDVIELGDEEEEEIDDVEEEVMKLILIWEV